VAFAAGSKKGVKRMKLYFRRSGGFAPIFMGLNIDTAENPAPDLEALVQ
jgi:hypothetical protein